MLWRHPRTGKLVSRAAAREVGAKRELWDVRRTRSGKVLAMRPVLTETTIVKTTAPGDVDRFQGRIDRALYRTNVATVTDVERYEVVVKGRDRREKAHRFRISVDLEGMVEGALQRARRKAIRQKRPLSGKTLAAMRRGIMGAVQRRPSGYLVRDILLRLRQHNFRTNYPLKVVNWQRAHESRSRVARRKVLHDMQITVTVKRRKRR